MGEKVEGIESMNLEKNGSDHRNLNEISGSFEGEKVEKQEDMKNDLVKVTNLERNGDSIENLIGIDGSYEGVKGGDDEKLEKREEMKNDEAMNANLEKNGNDDEKPNENNGSCEGVKGIDEKMAGNEKSKDDMIETMNLESIGNNNEKPIVISETCEGIKVGGDDEEVLTDQPKDDLVESNKNGNSIGINGSREDVKGSGGDEVEMSEEPKDNPLEAMNDSNLLGMDGSHEGVKDGVNDDLVESTNSGILGNSNEGYEAVNGSGDDETALGEKRKDDTVESKINENLIVVNESDEGVKGGLKDDLVETKNSGILGNGNEDMMGNNGSYDSVKGGDNYEVVTGDKVKDDELETLDSGKLGNNSENLIGINGSGEGVTDINNENLTETNESSEDGKGDGDNEVVSGKKLNDDQIETLSSGKFGNNNKDVIGRSESYRGVMGGGDDEVAPEEKPKYDNTEKFIEINGSNEGVGGGKDEVASGEKPKDDPIGKSPSSTEVKKGKGLRKWRRIKRDGVKEGSGSIDFGKPMKRGMPTSGPNPNRQQKSDFSLSSTGARVETFGKVVGPADSGNTRDRSSISSTMASTRVNGVHQGKPQIKNTKKARGAREHFEKESSISSLESDSRSSNFVFVQGVNSMTSNETQKEKVADHDGANSNFDGALDGEKCNRSNNKVGDDISKENEDLADAENQSSAPELDPLAKSISELQSAQEALEKELQKLREWGDESQKTTEEEVHEASSSRMFTLGENTEIHPHYLKKHVNTLKPDVDFSESRLEEVNAVLEAKKNNVTKLGDEEIEAEIENLYKQKLEAEFQYLVISRAVEKWNTDVVDQVALSDELETTLNVVRDARGDLSMLKRQTEKLETRVKDTIEIEQLSKLQKRVCQVTSCLFIELILLLLVVLSFVSELSPYDEVVPT